MFLFWRKIKAAETRNICAFDEEGYVNNQNYQKWFGKFHARDYPV